ncbi:hypothetical protein HK405_010868 [Cladochytrium tenue]|nr:hypothetical protein HK405_010868 [Cladochytrium tenue]
MIFFPGPFTKHGLTLVQACISQGTDYIDSTGEASFVIEAAGRFHEKAVEAGVKIVNSCGLDSIPFDMATYLVANKFAKKGLKTKSVTICLEELKFVASGGTINSAIEVIDNTKKLSDLLLPYAFIEESEAAKLPQPGSPVYFRYDSNFKGWQTQYVLRSWWLLSRAYGADFKYTEGAASRGPISALSFLLALGLASPLLLVRPVRSLIKWMFPSGTGPSEEAMVQGRLKIKALGEAEDGSKCVATVEIKEDPAYLATSKMLGESALSLLSRRLGTASPSQVSPFPLLDGGVLTASSALGMDLVERLRRAGFLFTVDEN